MRNRSALLQMRIGAFIGLCRRQHTGIVIEAARDLQTHRRAGPGKAARHARCRLLREVERQAEG